MAESAALESALRAVPGLTVARSVPLAPRTTLRIGGPAELWVEVASDEALGALRRVVGERGVPFQLLGLGSNVLVPDEGLAGIVARLGGELGTVSIDGVRVEAGAAVSLAALARQTARQGLVGLEALSGFPSTVGGAVCMNAGSYGTEIRDVLAFVDVIERSGERRRLGVAELEPSYRSTNLTARGALVTRAVFELGRGDGEAALARIEELNRKRWQSLPSGKPSAGSIFKNPSGDYAGRLIEVCGLKGRVLGGAQISPKHANVIVNLGGASARDVLGLMLEAHAAVRDRFAVELAPEVVLTGTLVEIWRARSRGQAATA